MKQNNNASITEEVLNSITHGIGALLSVAGLVVLLLLALETNSTQKIIAFSIFGITLTFMYLTSTLFHSFIFTKAKKVFRILDHSSIFLFIAGTYTPFAFIAMPGILGKIVLASVWSIAILGIILKIFYINKPKIVSIISYIAMGWLSLAVLKPLSLSLPTTTIILLISGGFMYTLGTIFYAWEKLKFNHAIWHLFVIGGSICHFFTMFYLLRIK